MKIRIRTILAGLWLITLTSCRENPHNTYGGPSNNPGDTAISRRDTSSVGTRTDGHQ